LIKLQDIVKSYQMGKNSLTVLKGINLDIQDGEMVAIMGPSGSGKTTLLNLIGCLDKATSGKYYFGDKDVSNFTGNELAELRGQKIGFIFQTFNLLSKLSALANVEMGMMYSGGVNRERAKEALEKVGLAERINHRPIELSGGEQQRIVIARALLNNPEIILADEPTGNLDPETSESLMNLLKEINGEGKTIVMATHDYQMIQKFPARKIICENGRIKDVVNDDEVIDFENSTFNDRYFALLKRTTDKELQNRIGRLVTFHEKGSFLSLGSPIDVPKEKIKWFTT